MQLGESVCRRLFAFLLAALASVHGRSSRAWSFVTACTPAILGRRRLRLPLPPLAHGDLEPPLPPSVMLVNSMC